MKPGEKLDKQVAKILGLDKGPDGNAYFSVEETWVVPILDKIRDITGRCVLLEASVNPKEYLCTVGWHHRGQWFSDFQVSAETAPHVVCLGLLEVS